MSLAEEKEMKLVWIDREIAGLFGEPLIENKRELFESEFFRDCALKHKEHVEQFLSKDNEGSQGICPKCQSDNTFPVEKQKRSADEPKSFDIICGNCSASWPAK